MSNEFKPYYVCESPDSSGEFTIDYDSSSFDLMEERAMDFAALDGIACARVQLVIPGVGMVLVAEWRRDEVR